MRFGNVNQLIYPSVHCFRTRIITKSGSECGVFGYDAFFLQKLQALALTSLKILPDVICIHFADLLVVWCLHKRKTSSGSPTNVNKV